MRRSPEEHLRQLTDPLPARRWFAVWALARPARRGNLKALGALRMSLNDSDSSVRNAAERALAVAEFENVKFRQRQVS
jgi:hypothetical protein